MMPSLKPARLTPRLLALILFFAMLGGHGNIVAADSEPNTWTVVIDVFSGLPNPVFTLQDSEVAQVRGLLAKTQAAAEPKSEQDVFPSRLGYRGMFIRQMGTNQAVLAEIHIRGKNILQKNGAGKNWEYAPDAALEQYLLDLAQARGAISAGLRRQIDARIAKDATNH